MACGLGRILFAREEPCLFVDADVDRADVDCVDFCLVDAVAGVTVNGCFLFEESRSFPLQVTLPLAMVLEEETRKESHGQIKINWK